MTLPPAWHPLRWSLQALVLAPKQTPTRALVLPNANPRLPPARWLPSVGLSGAHWRDTAAWVDRRTNLMAQRKRASSLHCLALSWPERDGKCKGSVLRSMRTLTVELLLGVTELLEKFTIRYI